MTAAKRLVLGTRGSPLALWQARHVAARLREHHDDLEIEERVIRTEGDEPTDRPLSAQAPGLFVRRIEQALLAREIDLAVHSLKDLPTAQPSGLRLAAFTRRHDPRDAIVSVDGHEFTQLPSGARLGTGSPRRRSQLLHARPDLRIEAIRGNVGTRVRRLREQRFDGLVLALAGLERLAVATVRARPLDPSVCLPAVGQGALTIEIREEDAWLGERLAVLQHGATAASVTAERAFLHRLGGGCLAPATAHATISGERIELRAAVGDPEGRTLLRDRVEGLLRSGVELGVELAERMVALGAAELLAAARDRPVP